MSKIAIDREVLEKALAALKLCDAALSEELAALDIDPPLHHVLEALNACDPAMDGLQEALAQPQQEPVAKIQITHYKGEVDGWRFVERPCNAPAGTYYVYASPQPVQPQPDQQ